MESHCAGLPTEAAPGALPAITGPPQLPCKALGTFSPGPLNQLSGAQQDCKGTPGEGILDAGGTPRQKSTLSSVSNELTSRVLAMPSTGNKVGNRP